MMKKEQKMSKEYKKPLPIIRKWSEKFWEGTKQNKYLIQTCKQCNAKIFHPRKFCPECWSEDLDWMEAKGTGKIYTYTITYAGAEERFSDDYPYVLALVDLDEGVRIMTNIVECDPQEVKIGMEVEVLFREISEDIKLPLFKPKDSST